MENNEYRRDLVIGFMTHMEGDALVIEGANYLPSSVDYTNADSVRILASSTIHTADGFYDLIRKNCNTLDPDISYGAHIEMYLSLSGLACEIYMKAIIYHENLHNGKQVRGHKLDDLFSQLPNITKETIKSKVCDIEKTLPLINDMFTTPRYDFELNHIRGDYLLVFQMMEELRAIAHIYPQKKPGAIKYANGVLMFE